MAAASSRSKQRQLLLRAQPAPARFQPRPTERWWTIRRASRQQQCTTQSRRTNPSRVETSRVELLGIQYPVARDAQSIQIKLHIHRANLHAARHATVTSTDYRRLTSLFEATAAALLVMPTRLLASHCL